MLLFHEFHKGIDRHLTCAVKGRHAAGCCKMIKLAMTNFLIKNVKSVIHTKTLMNFLTQFTHAHILSMKHNTCWL